jgi:hypothetical protein
MAIDSTFRSFSHAAILSNSPVVHPNSVISRSLPSTVGAHTQCDLLPKSHPARFRPITGKPSITFSFLLVLAFLIFICAMSFLA